MRDEITGLMSPFVNTEALATVLEHFRHEGQTFIAPIAIQCGEYLLLAENFHDFAYAKIQTNFHKSPLCHYDVRHLPITN
jgi:hypothetical protein